MYSVSLLFSVVWCRSLLGNTHALVQDPIRSWRSEQQLRGCCSCWVTLVQQPSPWNHPLRQVIPTRIWTKVERYEYESVLCNKVKFYLFSWTFVNGTCRVINLSLTHSLTYSLSWDATNCWVTQEILHIWNLKIHNCVQYSPPLVPILSLLNPIHSPTPNFFKLYFKTICPFDA